MLMRHDSASIEDDEPCAATTPCNSNHSTHDQAPNTSSASASSSLPDTVGYDITSLAQTISDGLTHHKLTRRLAGEGEGGTYFLTDATTAGGGSPVAIFKPTDEEIGMPANPHGNIEAERIGFEPGECYRREVAAYLLDHQHWAGVPPTWEAVIDGQTGSVQKFVPHCIASWSTLPGRFSVECVHRIAILDLRLLNCDRHGGNILVDQHDGATLVPIDHGYVLPDTFSDPEFVWNEWPQAARPFSRESLEYVEALDPVADAKIVAEHVDAAAAEINYAATLVLKFAARRGYTARHIANFFRRPTLTQPSGLECLLEDKQCPMDAALEQHFPLQV